jgi:hypothetical protein
MISEIAYHTFFGLPVVAYLGIITLLLLLSTATVGLLNYRGIFLIPFRWHPRLAIATITVAIIHAILASSIYLKL